MATATVSGYDPTCMFRMLQKTDLQREIELFWLLPVSGMLCFELYVAIDFIGFLSLESRSDGGICDAERNEIPFAAAAAAFKTGGRL